MFKTIREFMGFNPNCPNCGRIMMPIIRVERAENIYPQESEVLDTPDPYATVFIPGEKFSKNQFISYKSRVENNHLYLDSYRYYGNTFDKRICSFNLDTNQNTIELDIFKNFLSNYSCRLGMSCYVDKCINTCAYHYSSDKLYIDSKNNKLYMTRLYTQIFGVPINDDYYMLSNNADNKSGTTLTTKTKIVGDFPYIDLRKITSSEAAIRKIKTLLLFG